MSIHPQEIALLLNLCPICPDIQYKILMLLIGMNGTPTSNLFKAPFIFTFYAKNKKCFNYSSNPLNLSAYFRDLVTLANYKFAYCSSDEEKEYSDEEEKIEDLSYEAYYETNMAYILTYGDTSSYGYVDYMEKIKTITKKKLNKMIASEPVTEFI
jgi:hypothetical protein